MEVSWGEEEELMFACESPSPQPQPDDLHLDFDQGDSVTPTRDMVEHGDLADMDNLTDDAAKNPGPVETQMQTTTATSTTTKVKKKKSSCRSESISVESNYLPDDDCREVSVEKVRRCFGEFAELSSSREDDSGHSLRKRPKSSLEEEQSPRKSSLSKLNMLEEKQTNGHAPPSPGLHKSDTMEKKSEELKKVCKKCGQQVFAMECLKAEKAEWHKTCFRCSVCSKVLSVEAYSSNEGQLYCRPHFKELFQPKAVAVEEGQEKSIDRTEVIIRESQPAPLPEGCVRASEVVDRGLEDLHLDLKSKFQLFESLQHQEKEPQEQPPPQLPKRSGSVLAKLAKYQSKVGMDIGVPDEALAGGHGPSDDQEQSSDDEVDNNTRKPHILDEINSEAIDSVRNKWAQGMSNRSEIITEHRKEEQSKFRSRLLHGKNLQLKEMYERAVEGAESNESKSPISPDEIVKGETAKGLKELFEKGEFKEGSKQGSGDSKLDGEVFESAIAKQSRQLFKDLDKGGVIQPPPAKNAQVPKPKRIDRTESLNKADVIKSSEVIEEIVKPVDIGSKFKFFEEGLHQDKGEKKAFRITPPREDQTEDQVDEVEVYRDPSIVRSSDSAEPAIPATRTASKMLSVFRQLEQKGAQEQKVIRPLKEFTPPREPLRPADDDDDESSEEDSIESPQPSPLKEDVIKEVGSLARASSLRAKFERWEADEIERNTSVNESFDKEPTSIESTKDLRAKFENLKREEEEKLRKRRDIKVNRFVELTNSGVAMENCVICEKRVYVMEKTEVGGKIYHKNCLKCSHCKCQLRMDTFTSNKGTLYCTPHFKQLFKIKGNYDEGFGHETQRMQWEKKKAQTEDKEN